VSLFGAYSSVFLSSWLSVLGQVLKGFLKGQDRFRDVVQAEAVGPLPLAGLVLVADLNDDLGQRDLSAVVHHYVSENRGSDSAHFEGDFGFGHVPGIPDRLDATNQYDRTGRWGIYIFRLMLGTPRPREVANGATFLGERTCRQTLYEAAVR